MAEEPIEVAPVALEDEPGQPEDGIALCLSGGGYRAMIFHVGVLWRLNEARVLSTINRFSSVSGGSITAGVLALAWQDLVNEGFTDASFKNRVVMPLRKMASTHVDVESILVAAALPGITVSDLVAREYRKVLFGHKTLQDLPDSPRFVFNASNVQSGALWRFSKPYMRDWRVGEVKNPTIELAAAVGASSAFPPFLSPVVLKLEKGEVTQGSGSDLEKEPYTTRVVLTDGGVYDNLGLETAIKRYRTILVSDAGGKMQPEEKPGENWASHSKRILDLVDNQVRNLRKRDLMAAYRSKDPVSARTGAYWGIRTDIKEYQLPDSIPAPFARTQELAAIGTRLDKMPDALQERVINWGYAVCDAAIRKYWRSTIPAPSGLPYSGSGI